MTVLDTPARGARIRARRLFLAALYDAVEIVCLILFGAGVMFLVVRP